MTVDDAIAACGTEHVAIPCSPEFRPLGTRCSLCREWWPCRQALRAAAEYALRDAEAWRRVAVGAIDELHAWMGQRRTDSERELVQLVVGVIAEPERSARLATEAHRLVLAQMEEERKHG